MRNMIMTSGSLLGMPVRLTRKQPHSGQQLMNTFVTWHSCHCFNHKSHLMAINVSCGFSAKALAKVLVPAL